MFTARCKPVCQPNSEARSSKDNIRGFLLVKLSTRIGFIKSIWDLFACPFSFEMVPYNLYNIFNYKILRSW